MAKKSQITPAQEFPTDGLAKPAEAAKFLAVSPDTVYRMIYDGELPGVKVRGATRVQWSDVRKSSVPTASK